jgi:uncharacterized protein (TIGR00730 family)
MPTIGVFCGSSSRVAPAHRDAAAALGREIGVRGLRLVYGGGKIGLMGILADAALGAGGEVVGVIPSFLFDLEVAHGGLTELRVVDTMHERKRVMADLADGFVVLSGGFGTLEEAIEVVTWRQLGLHEKPVVFLDVAGFWRPLVAMVEHMIAEGFAHPEHARLLSVAHSVDEALAQATRRAPPGARADLKWS